MACKPGFFGTSCDSPCPLGFYGRGCGGVCHPNCSKEKCNKIRGCEQSTAIIIQTTNSEKNGMFVTEDPLDLSEFNSTYLLHGIGGAICLFLIAILIQLCKSKSTSRKIVKRKTLGKNDIQNESRFRTQEGNQRSYDTISESEKTVQDYQPLEAEYDEINETLQIHYPCSSKASDGYEKANILSKKLSLTHRIELPMNDIVLEQSSSSDQPILCAKNSGEFVSKTNASSYIDVTGAYIDAI